MALTIPKPKGPSAPSIVAGDQDWRTRSVPGPQGGPTGGGGSGPFVPEVPKPPVVTTTGTTSTGTASTPPAATTPPAQGTAPWWWTQYTADPRYYAQMPGYAARENDIALNYGFVIRRNTDQSSPTYGQAYFRRPGEQAGKGTIVQSFDTNGKIVYIDAQGNVVPANEVANLVMDIVEVGQDNPLYRAGALGRARMDSQGRQYGIGNQSAQAGVGSSGMRAGASLDEVRALIGALTNLTRQAGGEFRGVQDDRISLLSKIYDTLTSKAADTTGDPTGGGDTGGGGDTQPDPDGDANNDGIPDTNTPWPGGGSTDAGGNYTPPQPTPDNPKPPLSAGPNGSFMMTVNEITRLSGRPGAPTPKQMIASLNGLLDKYTLTNQQKTWIKSKVKDITENPWKYTDTPSDDPKPGQGGGNGGGSGGGGTGGGGGGSNKGTVGGIEPSGNRGNYTEIGTPSGSNVPQDPEAGQVYTGPGGTKWVYRKNGPKGAGWYRKPVSAGAPPASGTSGGGNTGGGNSGGGNTGNTGGGSAPPPPPPPPPPAPTQPWWDTMGTNTVGTSLMDPGSRGNFTVKASSQSKPSGSNLPSDPKPGTVFKGASGIVWVWREAGGGGWYKRP